MTEVSSVLRNRLSPDTTDAISTEELLIEKLDLFLSSIESRLDKFEQYFKFNNFQDIDDEGLKHLHASDLTTSHDKSSSITELEFDDESPETNVRSRRNSTSSLKNFKNFANLDLIHQRLKFIKQSVLKSSISNLDYLYKTLDDQYNYLFNSQEPFISSDLSFDTSKEILTEKIITTLNYFDEKLIKIDNLISKKFQNSNLNYNNFQNDDSIFNIFKFYNFNKALKISTKKYLHYYQLPLGWRENRYIIYGYRFSLNHSNTIKSMFHFNHNESMNIWTHLIGFFIMVYLSVYHLPNSMVFSQNTWKDNLVIYFFLACAMMCLLSSSIWHTYSSFAKLSLRYHFACIDYTGITILITSSIIAVEYVSFYNHPKLLNFFVIFSSICGTSGLAFNWSPYFDKPECRSLRIGYFVGLAFLGVATMFVTLFYEGFYKAINFFGPLFIKSFLWYWIGVIFYGGLIPERWRYDVIINDGDSLCSHEHNANDVLAANIEHSGIEEFEEIEHKIADEILHQRRNNNQSTINEPENHDQPRQDKPFVDEGETERFNQIISKHFPHNPTLSNYHNDFFSLWWVDYMFQSHNLWHIFVVLGILGHYFCLLEMFVKIRQ